MNLTEYIFYIYVWCTLMVGWIANGVRKREGSKWSWKTLFIIPIWPFVLLASVGMIIGYAGVWNSADE